MYEIPSIPSPYVQNANGYSNTLYPLPVQMPSERTEKNSILTKSTLGQSGLALAGCTSKMIFSPRPSAHRNAPDTDDFPLIFLDDFVENAVRERCFFVCLP